MHSKAILLAAALLAFCLAAPAAADEFYRWTDESGVLHISDQPPPPSRSAPKKLEIIKHAPKPQPVQQPNQVQVTEYIIPFQRAYGGMIVNVVFNDQVAAKMLVDTGATTLKLNVKLLRKLNQSTASAKKRKAVTAAGVVDATEIIIDKVDLGGAVKRDVMAGFTDESHDSLHYDGLLGLSFLSDFKMTIDYEKNQLHLIR
ncbi:MAG: retroviral-like aspartic protease family protein [Deltaproteobacteria bacterium]|nr:retroviral-like aspartic protease family protein [Deltaproteobacteria bacterium]